jgi:glycosyltransferase involved in cell wall biosynthesis
MAVDIILPTYNRPSYLARALASIRAQTYTDYTIVVVNDGGEDVHKLCELFGAQYLRHRENRGLPAARNTGIRATSSKLVAYLDDDDMWLPNHLEELVRFREQCGNRLVYSDAYYWFEERRYEVLLSCRFDRNDLIQRNMSPVCCVLHERSLFEAAGMFDEAQPNHEDYDLWLRMSMVCDFEHLAKATALYSKRTGSGQMSLDSQFMAERRVVVQERHRERMRA